MNYLAHFHLAAGDEGLIIGGLLGDYVKGPLTGQHPPDWEQGIVLHRKIDAYSDHHRLRQLAQQWLPQHFRRYSGILFDVLFDHYLSLHWREFHHQSLNDFSADIYQVFAGNRLLPEAARHQMAVFEEHNILVNYQNWETVEAALKRIGQRLQRANPLAQAADELWLHNNKLESVFLEFYPELLLYADKVRKTDCLPK